ncbi:CaiB/BaiF CoA-transferase family protein [Alkalihalobacillus sp. AL-G]|uniref:CaiB/BaiF CoA transferase family protein n=1 Tax=Alkalihalobacillus sp. AL-G TaxID=2926399 RepID=UPI00272A1226|nr:CoA transferase [Alkalihalobacillus sp. AL-G]WLD94395.1 CoA transferase [Alkalihalobacillus sp. AL-G]
MGPLQGMRILDSSQIMAGPYCSMVLADLGAEVTKIEKINGGDDSRQMGPYVNGESTCFFQINRNKKSVALDLKKEEGKQIFYDLVKQSDVFIENFRPGVTQKLQIDYDTLKEINPNLIYCSISGYGQTGPYSHKGGFDLVAQGMSGIMSMTGEPGGKPLKSGVAIYDIGAGITAAYSILAAYIHKEKTGEGQQVDVSLVECGLPWFTWEAAAYFSEGTIPGPTGHRHRVIAPYQSVKAMDGYMMLGCGNQRIWENFCKDVIGKPDLIEDKRFLTGEDRIKYVEELEAEIEKVLAKERVSYWIEKCEQSGVPAGPINNFAQVVDDPHYNARGMIQELSHPIIGNMKTIGIPSKFSKTPGTLKSASPILGQHSEEVLTNLQYSKEKIEQLMSEGVIFDYAGSQKKGKGAGAFE